MLQLPFLDSSALIIVPDADLQEATRHVADHFGASHRLRLYAYDAVLAAGSPGSLLGPDTSSRDVIEHTQSHYWNATSSDWLDVKHSHLVAGVTSNLAAFPADKIPNTNDHIFVEACAALDSPASISWPRVRRLASLSPLQPCTPVLPSPPTCPRPATTIPTGCLGRLCSGPAYARLRHAEGASSLACALASCTRRSPLASWAATNKLFTLRNGSFARNSLADTLVYNSARSAVGCSRVRTLMIAGRGDTVPQALLDSLRAHLGCAVLNAYVPQLNNAAVTAPVSVTHAFDLQAFAEHETAGMQVPAHVGPPSVAAEVKLLQTRIASDAALLLRATSRPARRAIPWARCTCAATLWHTFLRRERSTPKRGRLRATSQPSDPTARSWCFAMPTTPRWRVCAYAQLAQASQATAPHRHGGRQDRADRCARVGCLALAHRLRRRAAQARELGEQHHERHGQDGHARRPACVVGAGREPGGTARARLSRLVGVFVFVRRSALPSWPEPRCFGPTERGDCMAYHSACARTVWAGWRSASRATSSSARAARSTVPRPGEVLLAAWLDGEIDGQTGAMGADSIADSARATLDMVLRRAPRSRAGAISHRLQYVAL